MKKLLRGFFVLLAYGSMPFLIYCGKKDNAPGPDNCAANAQKVTDAAVAFSTTPNRANCEAYKISVRDFLKSCPSFYTTSQRQSLDEFMAEPCPQ